MHRLAFGIIACVCVATCLAQMALTPPRGWNSYDSFTWIVPEDAFLENCKWMAENLLPYGYEYCVIDYLWYQDLKNETLNYIDEYGRLIPDPNRWPSSKGGLGFKPIADKVHAMGLKFGIHIMRGISDAAVAANSPIKGTSLRARDIALTSEKCPWKKDFQSVDLTKPEGQIFYNSLYAQYASWGVDFIKNDCMFGLQFVPNQIRAVSKAISNSNRPMVYSLSAGSAIESEIASAKEISSVANMYRITGDDWDNWKDVLNHFDIAANMTRAGLTGAPGKDGLSWPDLDMLPFGWITTPGTTKGPYRNCNLTHNEQFTQMSLWVIAKSPLMFGGDMRKMDPFTKSLLTNAEMLDINAHSTQNEQVWKKGALRLWKAVMGDAVYAALFNTGDTEESFHLAFNDLHLEGSCYVNDVWKQKVLGPFKNEYVVSLKGHASQVVAILNCH